MTKSTSPKPATFGFLTVVELPQTGFCGGLLVVSQIGRPLEFHCTAPVSPNRAQQIMYGRTYSGFLHVDQIAMALIEKMQTRPTVLVTNTQELLPVTERVKTPLIYVGEEAVATAVEEQRFMVNDESLVCFNVDSAASDIKRIATLFGRTLPFDEPFERIVSAIEEANQVLRAG